MEEGILYKQLIFVTGKISAGKTYFCKHLCKRHGFDYINSGKIIMEQLRRDNKRGLTKNERLSLQSNANLIVTDASKRKEFLNEMAKRIKKGRSTVCVIDGMRSYQAYTDMLDIMKYKPLNIFIKCPLEICAKRELAPDCDDCIEKYKIMISHPVECDVDKYEKMADITFDNSGSTHDAFQAEFSRIEMNPALMKINVNANPGLYHNEYLTCSQFWDNIPTRYVREWVRINGPAGKLLDILDVGCGEGKNALYLASAGHKVMAIDRSPAAITHLLNRSMKVYSLHNNLTAICGNAESINFNTSFDVIILYGYLHCLSSIEEVISSIDKWRGFTNDGGWHILACLIDDEYNERICQPYLPNNGITEALILREYSDWNIVKSESEVITESHPTTLIKHSHNVFRLLVQKPF